MVRTAREKTTAEIVLWTSHVNDSKADLVKLLAERDDRSRAILDIAARYSCHVVDLNKKWCELLLEKVKKFDYEFQKQCVAEQNFEKLEMYVMELLMGV